MWGFDVGTGVSYLERAAQPWSSRVHDAQRPADLSPFVLEAERLWLARMSYETQWAYVAVDVERSLEDDEYRAYAIAGGRLELAW